MVANRSKLLAFCFSIAALIGSAPFLFVFSKQSASESATDGRLQGDKEASAVETAYSRRAAANQAAVDHRASSQISYTQNSVSRVPQAPIATFDIGVVPASQPGSTSQWLSSPEQPEATSGQALESEGERRANFSCPTCGQAFHSRGSSGSARQADATSAFQASLAPMELTAPQSVSGTNAQPNLATDTLTTDISEGHSEPTPVDDSLEAGGEMAQVSRGRVQASLQETAEGNGVSDLPQMPLNALAEDMLPPEVLDSVVSNSGVSAQPVQENSHASAPEVSDPLVEDIARIRAMVGSPVLSDESILFSGHSEVRTGRFEDSLRERIAANSEIGNSEVVIGSSQLSDAKSAGASQRLFRFPKEYQHLNPASSEPDSVSQANYHGIVDGPQAGKAEELLDNDTIFEAMQETIGLIEQRAAQLELQHEFVAADLLREQACQFRLLAREFIQAENQGVEPVVSPESTELPNLLQFEDAAPAAAKPIPAIEASSLFEDK